MSAIMKAKTIKIKIDPFKLEEGHAEWKRRKMGYMTSKGGKPSRSVRNRCSEEERREFSDRA